MNFNDNLLACKKIYSEFESRSINPLALAFLGDSVFSLYIKSHKMDMMSGKVNGFNTITKKYVNAEAQSLMLNSIEPVLTEDEISVVHRARNTNVHSKAKNFDIITYRHATSFEALIGYLYITNNYNRLNELLLLATESIEKEIK